MHESKDSEIVSGKLLVDLQALPVRLLTSNLIYAFNVLTGIPDHVYQALVALFSKWLAADVESAKNRNSLVSEGTSDKAVDRVVRMLFELKMNSDASADHLVLRATVATLLNFDKFWDTVLTGAIPLQVANVEQWLL